MQRSGLRPAADRHKAEVVVREAADGDFEAAERRSAILAGIDVLEVGQAALDLADELVRRRAVPEVAAEAALHIARSPTASSISSPGTVHVPVVSCPHCGESYLTAETLREMEQLKASRRKLAAKRSVPVLAFARENVGTCV